MGKRKNNASPIPKASIKKILNNEGANRVSADAVEYLKNDVENYAKKKANMAVRIAKHNNRKTVQARDVSVS